MSRRRYKSQGAQRRSFAKFAAANNRIICPKTGKSYSHKEWEAKCAAENAAKGVVDFNL